VNMLIYDRLTQLAKGEKLTTYGEIAPIVGLSMDNEPDRDSMSRLLAEVARYEESNRRPMLTAIVVHSGGDNNPGEGFFAIAKEFGRFNGSRDQLKRLEFWVGQVKAVHKHWH
jgi:hypothetical protein